MHAGLTIYSRDIRASWANVPPVPKAQSAAMMALGDKQLAYRMSALMVQNLGDIGGRVTPLYLYDYDRLAKWFFLADKMDERSNFMPLLAAFYFGGGTQDPSTLGPIIDYLEMVGMREYGEKWRWLVQAIYLARFRMGDTQRAMGLAQSLAEIRQPNMPAWTRQMPAFIASAQGDKQAAYEIIVSVLKDEREDLHPNEVNFMVHYICARLLDKAEAAKDPLCINRK